MARVHPIRDAFERIPEHQRFALRAIVVVAVVIAAVPLDWPVFIVALALLVGLAVVAVSR